MLAYRHARELKEVSPKCPDRGSQYACADYQCLMSQNGLTGSMSRKGDPHDNAVMESFFRTLKAETVYRSHFTTRR